MEKKYRLLQTLADGMDLPGEPLPGLPVVELWGQQRVLMENYRGIVSYSPEEILVRVSYGQVKLSGSAMELTLMTGEQLIISGKIHTVTLIGREVC